MRVHAVPGNADAVRVPGGAPGWPRTRAGRAELATMSLDRISLLGLRVFGRHGVLEHERAGGQEFVIDAVLWVDTRPPPRPMTWPPTVDYGALADRLAAIVAGEPVALIETLAQRLAAACLPMTAVAEAEITVHKPQAPVAQPVPTSRVTIRRSRGVTPPARARWCWPWAATWATGWPTCRPGWTRCWPARSWAASAVSPVYETAPVGGPPQPDYLNAVLLGRDRAARPRAAGAAARPPRQRCTGSGRSGGVRGPWTWTSSSTATRSAPTRC